MDNLLEQGVWPEQLTRLDPDACSRLAEEIRRLIIDTVAANGGHLASNLGMVELTIALLRCFDFRRDRIVFDVGHQVYAWKILTGRRDRFCTLRRQDGLAGFPKTSESKYDFFNTGHSSTSISAALGLRRAIDASGRTGKVIAVIGDGALSGGMSFEALNDAGHRKEDLLVILNDNQMSINRNVGGLSRHLDNLRVSRGYLRLKSSLENALLRTPLIGKPLHRFLFAIKRLSHVLLTHNSIFFEQLGFRYYGPIDGHDLDALESHLRRLSNLSGPVLLHVITQKGRGYRFAEELPDRYHGIAPFLIENGQTRENGRSFSQVFGRKLVLLAARDAKICAISAAMTSGTGLTDFAAAYPARFYDVGIAEQHAMTLAAGLAAGGMRPVIALYSTFLQRAYDQLLHDVCLQNLPVVVAIDRAGIVGEDGETHQGIYDLGLLLPLPSIEVHCPATFRDLEVLLEYALGRDHPVAIRYPRGRENPDSADLPELAEDPRLIRTLRRGSRATLAVLGTLACPALAAARKLADEGLDLEVLAVTCAKPLDRTTLLESVSRTGCLIFAEEALRQGGAGSQAARLIQDAGICLPVHLLGIRDAALGSGSRTQLLSQQRLTEETLAESLRQLLVPGSPKPATEELGDPL